MMKHLYTQGTNPDSPVLLLLHGTGGDERSLLPVASILDEGASVLSVRGNVSEQGMPRFFRRFAEGVFDEEDLVFRTRELNAFLDEAAETYGFDRDRVVAVGYSNGANIAASLLYHFRDALSGAVLHHPMVPLRDVELPDLSGRHVFIGAGTNDPIAPRQESEELGQVLANAGASVETYWTDLGHQLALAEVEAAKAWYVERYGTMPDTHREGGE